MLLQSVQRELESKLTRAVQEASTQAATAGVRCAVARQSSAAGASIFVVYHYHPVLRAGARVCVRFTCCYANIQWRLGTPLMATHSCVCVCADAGLELESWTKHEMLQLAAKLKAVVQSCSNHQQQVNLQVGLHFMQYCNSCTNMMLALSAHMCCPHLGLLPQRC